METGHGDTDFSCTSAFRIEVSEKQNSTPGGFASRQEETGNTGRNRPVYPSQSPDSLDNYERKEQESLVLS